ncbi:glutamate formimidoyltransferase-like isoform X2 [Lineus longissimus]
MAKRLVACLLNISEARNRHLVEEVAMAAIASNKTNQNSSSNDPNLPIKSSVLNIFSDYDYNRSVITIAASVENIAASVHDACVKAYSLIDLSRHDGGHPRLGAVDLVPLHPISADVTLEECGQVAKDLASKLARDVPGSAFFLFGHADVPECRGLVRRRKDVKWFDGKYDMDYSRLKQDVGPIPGPRYGMTGVGSIPYVMNCNVTIASNDLDFGKAIAQAIRATTEGGLPGVQSMAFHHEGNIEIACNVESIYRDDRDNFDVSDLVCSFGKFHHVPSHVLQRRVQTMAGARGIDVVGSSTIIGFTPEVANRVAMEALANGIQEFWRTRKERMM